MSAEVRANEIISRLRNFPAVGVEVGVSIGQTSEALLRDPRIRLYMVDSWAPESSQLERYLKSGDGNAHYTKAEQDAHLETARRVTDFAGDRRQLVRLSSKDAAKTFEDRQFDFVFIDADHSYEGCQEDIEVWKDKVKPGGLLCGHDYGHPPTKAEWTWGPKKAVDEACETYGWKLELGENFTWFVRM